VKLLAVSICQSKAIHEVLSLLLLLQLTSLKELDLSGNLLVELPNAVATLPKLEVCCQQLPCVAVKTNYPRSLLAAQYQLAQVSVDQVPAGCG